MSQVKATTFGFRWETAKRLKAMAGITEGETPVTPGRVRTSYGAIFLTPAGGISARTGTGSPWTPGVASCTYCEYYDDAGTIKIRTTSDSYNVYNMTTGTIAGSKLIQVKLIGGHWTIDVDPC